MSRNDVRLLLSAFLLMLHIAASTEADPYALPLEDRIAQADFVVVGRLADVRVVEDEEFRLGSGVITVDTWLKTEIDLPTVEVTWLARVRRICPKQPRHEKHVGKLALWMIRRSDGELTVGEPDVVLLETTEQARNLARELRKRADGRPEVIETTWYLEGLELPGE